MQSLDWVILSFTLLFIVVYGTIKTRKNDDYDEYVRAKRQTPSWAVALTVMATQASAITFLSIPGQAYHDGMSFIQFYFGLPLAMIFICIFFIPLFYKYNVYTAYELLEKRFDIRVRSLATVLFLIQRGLVAGFTIYAPSIILSTLFGWDLKMLIVGIGILVLAYTVTGGAKAIIITQKQQMFIIMTGMFAVFFIIIYSFPDSLSFSNALGIAAANDKMELLNFSTSPHERYTIWNGLTGGFFLMLAYFGTDQTQVGRYLTGKSINESRRGLLINGLLKIPMQFFILLIGVLVFVFFQFHDTPLHFNPTNVSKVKLSEYKNDFELVENEFKEVLEEKKEISILYTGQLYQDYDNPILQEKMVSLASKEKELRDEAKAIILQSNPNAETNDKDYVFLYFIVNYLPQGLVGLLIAVIFSAAMSASASELNALATATVNDIYKRNSTQQKSDQHYVKTTKIFTLVWGAIAIIIGCLVPLFENLVQLVNIVGSIFYGVLLGIFLTALFFKFSDSRAVFWAAICSQIAVLVIYFAEIISFLWLNLIGALSVIILSLLLHHFFKHPN